MTDHADGTVTALLAQSAQRHRSRSAIVLPHGQTLCTYGELMERSALITSSLRHVGVCSNDVVMVSLPTSAEMLIAILGTINASACAPVNPSYTVGELSDLVEVLRPRAAVALEGHGGAIEQVARQRNIPLVFVSAGGFVVGSASDTATAVSTQSADIALVLHTAGTTARPKQVPLSHANLVAAANNVVASLDLTPDDRCLNVMPLFHSHGLLGAAMSSLSAGSSIVCANGMDPRRFLGWATDTGSNWYTAAATIHHLVLDAPGDWPELRFMRSASAPLAPQIASALEDRFGAPMIEVYGMTEAYQIAANPLPPGKRRLGTVGLATGTEIAIADTEGNQLPAGTEGEVLVRGPAVFGGYSWPPDANDEAFWDDWFRTGDLGTLSADGYLSITGRHKEQINRGGEKIAPREVDEALLAHPDVIAAMTFAIPDAVLGEEVGVAIVTQPGAKVDVASIRTFLHGRLAPFKVPRRVLVVDELPKSETGKFQRIGYASAHAEELAPRVPSTRVVARDAANTQDRLSAIWQDLLALERPPAPTDQFFDLGGTSLLTMELVTRIEDVFGVDLPVIDVIDVPTLEEMAARVVREEVAGATPLLHRYRSGTSGVHLILVPGQMGMAIGLDLIADAVTADVDVFLFDYPGHRAGEQPANSIEALAARLVAGIEAAGLNGPLALYGNSLGSWVVFETARVLDSRGRRPLFVGIGDLYSPYFNSRNSPSRPPFTQRLRNRWNRSRRQRAEQRLVAARSEPLPLAEQRRQAVIKNSALAMRRYEPHPYAGDLLVVAADERAPKFGPNLGWDRHVTGSVASLRLHGLHGTMHREQAVEIGDAITRMLSEQSDQRDAPSGQNESSTSS